MNRTTENLKAIFERDINTLKKELALYENEADLWVVNGAITNSAGNLFLHLCGNLKHFIGAVLGDTGYVRERDREFNDKNVSRAEIDKSIDETLAIVSQTIENLDPETLGDDFPQRVFQGKAFNTELFLLHLSGHLMYHLGQINYHRRLLSA